jgi:hypothetical protein
MSRSRERALLVGAASGTVYGIIARLVANTNAFGGAFAVMSLAFLFCVPITLGVLTVSGADNPSWPYRLFAPWLPSLIVVALVVAIGLEGSICVVMALPVLLVFSSIGGMIGAARPAHHPAVRPVLIVLPFVLGPIEQRSAPPTTFVETTTEITIEATPETIWPLIASVDSIRPSEQRPALFTRLGFPKPISANISGAGIGAVRMARFERGLVFVETVTDWDDRRRLAFTIRPNTEAIPATTLDSHVTIGGPYFDVLTGTYELHPVDGRRTRLVLRSRHRLSTRFNLYAGWWADRVMRSIQDNILHVHKARAEARALARTRVPITSRRTS